MSEDLIICVAGLLKSAGWRDTCDAQWTGLEKLLPELREALGCAQPAAPEVLEALEARKQPAAQAVPEGWIKLTDYLPPLGKYILLCKDGVVQRISFYLAHAVSDFAGGEYFWATDDVIMDEYPATDFERDCWMPIPAAPTPPAGDGGEG